MMSERKTTPPPWRVLDGQIIQTNHITRDVWVLPRTEGDLYLMAAAPAMLAALEAVEWVYDTGLVGYWCPDCENEKEKGHADDCQLAAALKLARGEQ